MDNQDEIKKLKKTIKELKSLLKESNEENDLLWSFLDEVREQEKQLMSEIGLVIDDYIIKNMKPIGDA